MSDLPVAPRSLARLLEPATKFNADPGVSVCFDARTFSRTLENARHAVDEAVRRWPVATLWRELLVESQTVPRRLVQPLWQNPDELTRIFVKSRPTARSRRFDAESQFLS
jgi:hypothetical protein